MGHLPAELGIREGCKGDALEKSKILLSSLVELGFINVKIDGFIFDSPLLMIWIMSSSTYFMLLPLFKCNRVMGCDAIT